MRHYGAVKWVLVSIAALVCVGVASFAVYGPGWRDGDTGSSAPPTSDTGLSTSPEAPTSGGASFLSPREAAQLNRASGALVELRNDWATGGTVSEAEVDAACDQFEEIVRSKPFAADVREQGSSPIQLPYLH